MIRKFLMIFALIATIAINCMTSFIPFGGLTTYEIINKVPLLFVPASYVYGIWIFVYVFLIWWCFSLWKNEKVSPSHFYRRRSTLFIFSLILQSVWFILWHFEYFGWSLVIMGLLLLILTSLYFTFPMKEYSVKERIPISVFYGWTFILFIFNGSYVLTLYDWSGWGLSTPLWTVIYLTVATAFALHFLYHYRDVALNFVFIWVFVGIAIQNGFEELFVSVAALFLTAVMGVAIPLINKRNSLTE